MECRTDQCTAAVDSASLASERRSSLPNLDAFRTIFVQLGVAIFSRVAVTGNALQCQFAQKNEMLQNNKEEKVTLPRFASASTELRTNEWSRRDGRSGKGRDVVAADSGRGLGAEQPLREIAQGILLRLEQVRAGASPERLPPRAPARARNPLPASSPRQVRHAALPQLRPALRLLLRRPATPPRLEAGATTRNGVEPARRPTIPLGPESLLLPPPESALALSHRPLELPRRSEPVSLNYSIDAIANFVITGPIHARPHYESTVWTSAYQFLPQHLEKQHPFDAKGQESERIHESTQAQDEQDRYSWRQSVGAPSHPLGIVKTDDMRNCSIERFDSVRRL